MNKKEYIKWESKRKIGAIKHIVLYCMIGWIIGTSLLLSAFNVFLFYVFDKLIYSDPDFILQFLKLMKTMPYAGIIGGGLFWLIMEKRFKTSSVRLDR